MLFKSVSDFEIETRYLHSILESSPREPQFFYYDGKCCCFTQFIYMFL